MTQKIDGCDNVREVFTSTGSTITLGGASGTSRAFASISGLANGDTFWGVARKGSEYSIGIFTWNTGGTVSQTTVWFSSNANAAVTFSAGTGEIFVDAPSRLFDELNLKEITVASATTCDIGAVQAGKILISGTTTITGLGTTIDKRRFVRFSGILTLTHNATSLILPGGANIVTAAGDTGIFMSDSSGNWRCYAFQRANRYTFKDDLSIHGADIASASTVNLETATGDLVDITGTTTITAVTLSEGHERTVRFTGILTFTNGASLVLPSGANITTAAGDFAILRGYAAGVVRCVDYVRASGTALVAAASGVTSVAGGGLTITATGTLPPSFGLVNHSLAVSASAGALTIALKDNAGADPSATSPVTGNFRSPTATTGSWVQRSVTAALSVVLASGSTYGVTSSTAFRLWVVLFDDGGTMRLGVRNCSSATQIYPLVEGIPTSSTQDSGSANSAGVFYTSGAAVSSKSFLIVGYVEWSATGLTAGTWTTTNVNFVQSFGPGIKKPGEVIQEVPTSTTTQTDTTSTSFVSTNLSQAITPTSAANFIDADASGPLFSTNTVFAYSQLHRAGTAIGVVSTAVNVGTNIVCGVRMFQLDKPNTTSSTTYDVRIKSSSGSTSSFPYTNSVAGAAMVLKEIMA